ncbi:hypothetical protein MTR67_019307 [Solanum verrucosum]|uniref:DUF4283 domain-containing protein n=1 Tax=Solanum verrucosum TaxID=315347 RepID=A0AAF0QNI0_SOLVR|nr:hypothetical protein MTR67_019307 [Solanum verrucosum]
MIVNENLEYAVIGKFSYGWPDIQYLRKLIPKQCELKGECNIGLLSNIHVLIRATLLEDYVHLLSKPAFYITQNNWSFPMRTLKWDPMFNPEEETTTTIAGISFPSLPPKFFGEEAVFSLAAAVGKPLQVDLATKNQTRPSCARVKGHNEEQCFVVHPELYPKEKVGQAEGRRTERLEINHIARKTDVKDPEKGGNQKINKEEDFVARRHKKWGGDKPRQLEKVWNRVGVVGVITGNKFNILAKEGQKGGDEGEKNILPVQETKEDTPGVQMSDNKVKKSNK